MSKVLQSPTVRGMKERHFRHYSKVAQLAEEVENKPVNQFYVKARLRSQEVQARKREQREKAK